MSDNGSIAGKVINRLDGQPLSDANLELTGEGGSWTTTSDGHGDFKLADLAPGSYELTAKKRDFEDDLYGPLVVLEGISTTIRIALEPKRY